MLIIVRSTGRGSTLSCFRAASSTDSEAAIESISRCWNWSSTTLLARTTASIDSRPLGGHPQT